MKPRQRLLVAVLAYLTLDLALPAMPGAFVFDAASSVESVQANRVRVAGDAGLLPRLVPGSSILSPPRIDVRGEPRPAAQTARATRRAVCPPPRAALAPAPASEDPQ